MSDSSLFVSYTVLRMSAPEVIIDNGANGEDDDLDMGEDAPATTEDGATDGNDAGIDDLGGIETETTETPTFLESVVLICVNFTH